MAIKIVEQNFEVLTPKNVYEDFLRNIERFGRVCYKSEGKISEESAERFVKRIIANGHESVLEHCCLTIKFVTDRAIANALVRHRHCAFSQESTHYIDYSKKDEIQIIRQASFTVIEETAINETIEIYLKMKGLPSSIRRAFLPLCLKTELVMTTNIREWRHILRIRTEKGCHRQMRRLILGLLFWFKNNLSLFVEDIG